MAIPPLDGCPFDGKVAAFKTERVAEDAVETWVECCKCGASTGRVEGYKAEYEVAADLWNMRWGASA